MSPLMARSKRVGAARPMSRQLAAIWLLLWAGVATCQGEHTALDSGGDGPVNAAHTCKQCHLSDYEETTTPPHKSGNINTDCADCHTTEGWAPAVGYEHPQSFPLTGKHAGLTCSSCHENEPKPSTDCANCHLDDYLGSTSPPHAKVKISKDCATCHKNTGWQPAPFTPHESVFPLQTSKKHKDISCGTCHNDPKAYLTPGCLTFCHGKGEMDDEHDEEFGYEYSSEACLSCHPKGIADD